MPAVHDAIVILYVADQARSRAFWTAVLGVVPRIDVPGMTELPLVPGTALGLMPAAGIRRLLGPGIVDGFRETGLSGSRVRIRELPCAPDDSVPATAGCSRLPQATA